MWRAGTSWCTRVRWQKWVRWQSRATWRVADAVIKQLSEEILDEVRRERKSICLGDKHRNVPSHLLQEDA